MSRKLDVLIVGFGAVGIIYGYLLERHNQARVTAVARSKYTDIIENGINIHSVRWGEVKAWRPHKVVRRLEDLTSADCDQRFDYVFLCTKSIPEVADNLRILEPLVNAYPTSEQPTYVILQNGLGVERSLYHGLDEKWQNASAMGVDGIKGRNPMVISCALYIMANVLENGDVLHVASDKVVVGVYRPEGEMVPGNAPEEQAFLDSFTEFLNASGLDASSVPNIGVAKYSKNLWNASIGMVSCLTRLSSSEWTRDTKALENAYKIVKDMLSEILLVARAMGYDEALLPSATIDSIIENEKARTLSSNSSSSSSPSSSQSQSSAASDAFVTSALLDIRNGNPFELEVILGAVVQMGREKAMHIPTLELIYGALSIVQNDLLRNKGCSR